MSEYDFSLPPFEGKALTSVQADEAARNLNRGIESHNVREMRLKTDGSGRKVCVIDTGQPSHMDILYKFDKYQNRVPRVLDTGKFANSITVGDRYGHSTHVAGIIGGSNTKYQTGIAPGVDFLFAKALSDGGFGRWDYLAKAILWAQERLDKNDFINMSLGGLYLDERVHRAIKLAVEKGIHVVCAAGNTYSEVLAYPAAFPETISIGALDTSDVLASFSTRNEFVDFACSGTGIFSTYKKQGYASMRGTSMAAPTWTGMAILVVQAAEAEGNPVDGRDDLINRMKAISIDLGDEGRDISYGWGKPVFPTDRSMFPITPSSEFGNIETTSFWIGEIISRLRKALNI